MKIIFCIVVGMILFANCGHSISGNGSEITNGYCVAGADLVSGVQITAYPLDYNPISQTQHLNSVISDSQGNFSIKLSRGIYNLHLSTIDSSLGAFLYSINSGDYIGEIDLQKPGYIAGIADSSKRSVIIKGSPFYSAVNEQSFFISYVPSGIHSLSFLRTSIITDSDGIPNATNECVQVNSGDTSFVDFIQ